MSDSRDGTLERIRDDAHAVQILSELTGSEEWEVDPSDAAAVGRRGRACFAGGLAHLHRGEYAEAAALFQQAMGDLEQAGWWVDAARCTMYLGQAAFQLGNTVLATHSYARADQIASTHDVGVLRFRARGNRARALRRVGRLDEADAIYRDLLDDMDATRDADGLISWRLNAASTAMRLGDHDRASELLDRVDDSLAEISAPVEMTAWARTMRVWLEVNRGDREAALAAAEAALVAVQRYGQFEVSQSLERASLLAKGLPGASAEEHAHATAALEERLSEAAEAGRHSQAVDILDDLLDLAKAHGDVQAQLRLHERRMTLQALTFDAILSEHERLADVRAEVQRARARGEREHLRAELLKGSNERLAALDRQRRRLLLATAHDLRTPLTALQLTIGLSRQFSPRDIRGVLDDLEEAAQSMADIVDQSLSEQAISAGRPIRAVGHVDLAEVVKRVVNGFDSIVKAKRLHVSLHADDTVMAALDAVAWSRIVQNLLSNAVKFARTGGRVEVRLERVRPQGPGAERILLSVRDDGPGFPPELLEHGPGWGRRGTDTLEPGSGIGLMTIEELVHSLDGSLSLQRPEAGGALAVVRLPASR